MKGIRATRPLWTVFRMERDEFGQDDGAHEAGRFWTEEEALAEQRRLTKENSDPRSYFIAIEVEATVVYPDDEEPPWVDDPDRLKKRGWEAESYKSNDDMSW